MTLRRWIALMAFIVVGFIAAAEAGKWEAEKQGRAEAGVNYSNSLASCEAGNPVRALAVKTAKLAAESRRVSATTEPEPAAAKDLELASGFEDGVEAVLAKPHTRPNGERVCSEAINRP